MTENVVLRTSEGKKVVVNRENDKCLYYAPHNPPNTGRRYLSGTDLHTHTAKSGAKYFYTYSWSKWEGTEDKYNLITSDEMKDALLEHASDVGYGQITEDNRELIEKHFPGLFDEDA